MAQFDVWIGENNKGIKGYVSSHHFLRDKAVYRNRNRLVGNLGTKIGHVILSI